MKFSAISGAALSIMLALLFMPQQQCCAAEKDGGFIMYPGASGAPGPVVFSHKSHGSRGAGFACRRCHLVASGKMSVKAADGVHQGQMCGSCHDGKTKGSRGRLAAAPVQDCAACHMPASDIIFKLNRMDPVAFSHFRHLSVDAGKKVSKVAAFSCNDCHPTPFERISNGPVGMEVPHETGGCAHCHNGKKRRDGMPTAFTANTRCLTCHKSSEILSKEQQP
jgi:c(7)-type cytochrome triheme protein